jgi:hypothetical protein
MLAVIVAHGNAEPKPFMANEIRYRAMPPKKLPVPTRRMSLKKLIQQIPIDISQKCKDSNFPQHTLVLLLLFYLLSLVDGEQLDVADEGDLNWAKSPSGMRP